MAPQPNTTAPTGPVGPQGAPSAHQPGGKTTGPTLPLPKTKAKVWNETPQGARLEGAYGSLRSAFQTQLPSTRQQLQTLTRRPIGG